MRTIEINKSEIPQTAPKLSAALGAFEQFINELNDKNLPDKTIEFINQNIERLNSFPSSDKKFKALLIKTQSQITKFLEKEHKYVPKNYYRNLWIPLGMTGFGLPIGVAFALSVGNMGLLGIGLPIGLLLGALVGTRLDKKALVEGRQFGVELKNTF
ncbi:hypothetical protein SAMN05660841_03326 [Sphingobacterium nematocida]|uniref:Uncharacterized protein n=1 Tax=Sphingobacterium nematocida TaxID=1513896 RepID=A0A1T5FKJ6_9SPHI|nr:hypothetical protein [Sphingobacterium nematocida]SKB96744.1 hypothetical protein SAMN05660841_03326 [Sphingobacterium nematocida]